MAAGSFAATDDNVIPAPRADNLIRRYGNEAVAWPANACAPVFLDPVAALVLEIVDGRAAPDDLIDDVTDVLRIERETAAQQVSRAIEIFNRSGLLEGAVALEPPPTDLDLFRDPPND